MFELVYPLDPAPIIGEQTNPAGKRAGSAVSECLPVVDTSGAVIARAWRRTCHDGASGHEKPLHPVVHLHIIDRYSRIYLQKRSMEKDLCPGLWDTAVGGHVTYGEGLLESLFREAGEELGFRDFNPILLRTYVWESEVEKELVNVFATISSKTPKPDNAEVDEGRFWTTDEIDAALGKGILTPQFEQEYAEIKNDLLALL